jgi:RNA polymerase sigma-70 factor, ECF subfamily
MVGSSFFDPGELESSEREMNPQPKRQPERSGSHGQVVGTVGHSAGREALSQVWEQVYAELHELARAYMAREDRRVTLQPTALVHEAFIKLSRQDPTSLTWRDRTHFFRIAASAMRQILVDHARRRKIQEPGLWAVDSSLSANTHISREPTPNSMAHMDILELDNALTELSRLDERKARVIELRFFGGLTGKQISEALGISPKTVEADWHFSRSWLRNRFSSESADGS